MMSKSVVFKILVAICLISVVIAAIPMMTDDGGQGFDMDCFWLSLSSSPAGVLWFTAVALIVRWMAQVQISRQILFSFFFYNWRNAVYGRADAISTMPFSSLGTDSFRAFCFLHREVMPVL
jgi:hypothetical protein